MATERVIALKNSDGAYDSGDWSSWTTDKNTRSNWIRDYPPRQTRIPAYNAWYQPSVQHP